MLESGEPGVVALGGGALTVAENRSLLNDRAYRIFIKSLARSKYSRGCGEAASVRPMLGSRPTLSRIKELYARRMPEYENADHVIDADAPEGRTGRRRRSSTGCANRSST